MSASLSPVHPTAVPEEGSAVRAWKVAHAADSWPRVLRVAEAQGEAGMLPALLTSEGWFRPGAAAEAPPAAGSPIQQWREVRRWRSALVSQAVEDTFDLVHAHCFAAAMAAVRGTLPAVCDVTAPLGSVADAKRHPWLLRSLAVAEAFVLTRAAAVVVHGSAMANWALRKGVAAENVFQVPDPMILPPTLGAGTPGAVPFLALGVADPPSIEMLLRAFAVVAEEIEGARLVVEAPENLHSYLAARAASLALAGRVQGIRATERAWALGTAEMVIIAEDGDAALAALAHGRALLAADAPGNRDITREGRGCLWYRPGADRDLAFRAAFLARNPDLRAALGRAGRAHLEAKRSPRAVAIAYDEVYRHAVARRGNGGHPQLLPEMPALQIV